jgi:hypothetical protein
MSTIYTGSNFGIISTLNSGSGNLSGSGSSVAFAYENIQNYTSGSIFINLSTNGYATLTLYFSNDATGTITLTESYVFTKTGSQTINFTPNGNYLKLVLTSNIANVTYSIQTKYNNTGGNFELSDGVISSSNSQFLSSISAGNTYTGSYEDISNYSLITLLVHGTGTSPADGTITCYFSSDGTNIDRTVSYPVQDCTANSTTSTTSTTFNPAHTLLPISKYFKVNYVNGSQALTDFRLTVLYHKSKSKPLTSRVTQFLTDYVDSDTTRSILNGRTEGTELPGGNYQNLNVSNGSLTVKIKEPISAFGEILNAQLTPQTQFDFTNGRPLDTITFYRNNIGNTYTSYNFTNSKAQIITTSSNLNSNSTNSQIEMLSRIFIKYKQGEGSDTRFTARFPSGQIINNCDQYAGIFTQCDGLQFGYFSGQTEFGIRHIHFGSRQIVLFTISATTPANGSLQISFGGTTLTIGITNLDTALTISKKINDAIISYTNTNGYLLNTYGWESSFYTLPSDSNYYVECIYNHPQTDILVTVNSVPSGVTVNVSTLSSGEAPEIDYYPQSDWNIDTCKDMGSLQQNYILNKSGFRLDPSKGNVYKIAFQYLGFGSITFYIELPEVDTLVPVHRIKYVNSNLNPSMKNPNMQIGIGIKQLGSTTSNGQVETGSMATFTQGQILPTGINRSYGYLLQANTTAGIGSLSRNSPGVIFGIKSTYVYNSRNSDATINYTINTNNIILSTLNIAVNTTSNQSANIIFMLIKNPTTIITNRASLTSYPSFIRYNDNLNEVINGVPITTTTDGTTIIGGTIILEFSLSENQNITQSISNLNIEMSKYDSFYLCFYGNSSNNADISGSISYQINM